jgi:hypothetical protein
MLPKAAIGIGNLPHPPQSASIGGSWFVSSLELVSAFV